MPIAALLLAMPAPMPPCRPSRLSLSLIGRDGEFDGMSHSGVEVAIRNHGPACTLPALPAIALRDASGHDLPIKRRPPVGMHPGPVMLPFRLAHGHSVVTDLRWVSGPVYPHNVTMHVASLTVRIGPSRLRAPLMVNIFGEAGQPATFDQTPLRAKDMAR